MFDGGLDFITGPRQVAHRIGDIDAVADFYLADGAVEDGGFDGSLGDGLDGSDYERRWTLGWRVVAKCVEGDDAAMGGPAVWFVSFEGDAAGFDEVVDR